MSPTRAYSPQIDLLLAVDVVMPLKFGHSHDSLHDSLTSLAHPSAFGQRRWFDEDEAKCAQAALWLRFDFFEESHSISQDIETASGSYWHGILHRREGDFWNAKYWMRRCANHPAGPQILAATRELVSSSGDRDLMRMFQSVSRWDGSLLVDVVEAASSKPTAQHSLALQLQDLEWWLLFDYSYRAAVGSS